MARTRSIKPSFFTNEYLSELEPLARLLFAGLWCYADREGRLEDRPKRLKQEILPYDNCDIDELLKKLALSPEKFIIRYSVGDKQYIQITKFVDHQNPHIKEPPSIIPKPVINMSALYEYDTGLVQAADENSTSTELVPEQSNRELIIGNQEIGKREPAGQEPDEPQKEILPYKEIVDHLNKKAGTAYRYTSQKTRDLIQARFNEKFTLQDFYTVIDKKVDEWNGTEWQKFIRPETLFSNKFEGYLNQINKPPGKQNKPPQAGNFGQRQYTDDEFEGVYKDV
jgi:uncharacterized phage protein (TIGR02220 family)